MNIEDSKFCLFFFSILRTCGSQCDCIGELNCFYLLDLTRLLLQTKYNLRWAYFDPMNLSSQNWYFFDDIAMDFWFVNATYTYQRCLKVLGFEN